MLFSCATSSLLTEETRGEAAKSEEERMVKLDDIEAEGVH